MRVVEISPDGMDRKTLMDFACWYSGKPNNVFKQELAATPLAVKLQALLERITLTTDTLLWYFEEDLLDTLPKLFLGLNQSHVVHTVRRH